MNIKSLKLLKEQAVADAVAFDGDDDLCPMMEVHRGDDMVALITGHRVDKHLILDVAGIAAGGYSATHLSAVFDAHVTTATINPSTGEQWKPGEMQAACENGACDLGLITDCLMVVDAQRDGLLEMRTLPYHVHKSTKQVAWAASMPDGLPLIISNAGEDQLEGFVPGVFAAAFAQREAFSMLTRSGLTPGDFGLSMADARTHADCAITRVIMQTDVSVMLNGLTDDGLEIIKRSLDRDFVSLESLTDTDPTG